MPREILFYSSIYSYYVSDFIMQMEEAKAEDVDVRLNTPGGVVVDMYGAVAKFHEHPKSKKIKVDGRADSGGAFMCCYAEIVECLDVSTFLFHRAAYPEWIEADERRFTDFMREDLEKMNKQLRAAMEGKMRDGDFQKVTGVSYDDLFSLDSRIDVILDAKQAKKLGLVTKINTITPAKKAEIESTVMAMAMTAFQPTKAQALVAAKLETEQQHKPQPTKKAMTAAEFEAQHPDQATALINKGVAKERDRAGAWATYVDVDPEAVAKAIKEGAELTRTQEAEMNRKALSSEKLGEIKADSPKPVATAEAVKELTAEEKAKTGFEADVLKNLGIVKK